MAHRTMRASEPAPRPAGGTSVNDVLVYDSTIIFCERSGVASTGTALPAGLHYHEIVHSERDCVSGGQVAQLRSGRDYLSSLRDGRRVVIADRVVDDVAADPATAAMASVMADLLDAHRHDERLVDGDGRPWAYSPAHAPSDVVARGRAFETVARASGGLLGRSPDFLATILTSWRMAADSFGEYGHNVVRYWERCRDQNLVLTHAITDPPADRYLPSHAGTAPQTLRVVAERDDGVVVRGAKILATLAPFADELLVYPYRQLRESDADLALCFAVPAATDGLTLFCRPSLAADRPEDRPFAGRFDEMDAICVFEDVLVPWERLFILRDPDTANRLRSSTGMTAYAWHQSSVRAWVKAALVFAIAHAVGRAGGRATQEATRQQLGELAGMAETLRALVLAAEAGARMDERGCYVCDEVPLAAAAMQNARLYPRAVELLQLVVGTGLVVHPLSADEAASARSRPFFDDCFTASGVSADEHGRLLRAAADLALDRFGARQVLYERVFVGPPDAFRAKFYDIYDSARRGDADLLRTLLG
jgi:aromatic ring hydroxylase